MAYLRRKYVSMDQMRARWPQCIYMSGGMAAQRTPADGHDRGRSRLTVTLCALFRACAADSHIYFRAVESGNLLIRQWLPIRIRTSHSARHAPAQRPMQAPSNAVDPAAVVQGAVEQARPLMQVRSQLFTVRY